MKFQIGGKMNDDFFDKRLCDRCGEKLHTRYLSWFNWDVICNSCYSVEKVIKKEIEKTGLETEGIGIVPILDINFYN